VYARAVAAGESRPYPLPIFMPLIAAPLMAHIATRDLVLGLMPLPPWEETIELLADAACRAVAPEPGAPIPERRAPRDGDARRAPARPWPRPTRRRPPRRLIALVLVGVIVAVGWLLWQRGPGGGDGGLLRASGTVEADDVAIQTEIAARVTDILVREGDRVR